jgi:predicted ATPase
LDPGVRRLVADAAVLGTSFPDVALIAVSGQDEPSVRAALAELVRREVLSVSADPLSPERGSYQFAQQMLRQVAYDTLSRRDRKTLHLAVAAHLRTAFAGDGEEVGDVIARHYLDALEAVPDAPDAAQIRGQAIAALIRAAERAERTGAPALAVTAYATAADLAEAPPDPAEAADGQPEPAVLRERAAKAAIPTASWAAAVQHAGRAREHYLRRGQARAAARAQAITGEALRRWGHHAEAREQLTAAVEVLRADPDTDTVHALAQLAALEVSAGSPDADRLSLEAVALGQAAGVETRQAARLLSLRGFYLAFADRYLEAGAYLRESARLAEGIGDSDLIGVALVNLAEVLGLTDPAAAAETARTAAGHLRRAGNRDFLAWAVGNAAEALQLLGDWDSAEAELTRAADADGLADHEFLACHRALLAALRGDTSTARTIVAGLTDLRASEDPQDKAMISLVEAFTAAARRLPQDALGHARAVLAHASSFGGSIGISHSQMRWGWPLAARTAHDLDDADTTSELLTMLDSYPPGHVAPMLTAERALVRARLSARDGDPAAGESFAAAVRALRELSTPYHLAHGLLDHAQYAALHDPGAAEADLGEARDIAARLRCQPLLDRAAGLARARPPVQA